MHIIQKESGRIGSGNWDAVPEKMINSIMELAAEWKTFFSNIQKPWLCWGVEDKLCQIQQKLVLEAGYTPIVGHDTNLVPTIVPGSRYFDFNSSLKLSHMIMFFPLEFSFLFTKKIAFWHSDFLVSREDMAKCVAIFDKVSDGEMAMVWNRGRWLGMRDRHANKWYALIGCTTQKASSEQYKLGCGFWRHIEKHPNYRKDDFKKIPHYDHEIGITMWNKKYGGTIHRLTPSTIGHMTSRACKHDFSKEEDLARYQNVEKVCKTLGIEDLCYSLYNI